MTFEAAALKFALTMVPGVLGWFRGRRIKEVCGKAYEAAASRAIDNCEKRGYPTRSHVWNELSTLLQDAKRAQALARLMRRSIGQLPQYQRVLSVAPETETLVADFLSDLNERLAEALPEEQRFSLQVQLNALALIAREIRPRLTLTRYADWLRPGDTSRGDVATLVAQARYVKLIGRKREQRELWAWLEGSPAISLRVLTGMSGQGKTRLALQLCDDAAEKGWHAGFLSNSEAERLPQSSALVDWQWGRPTLLVVDYVSARAKTMHGWFKDLSDHAAVKGGANSTPPLRFLLLERHANKEEGWWPGTFGIGGSQATAIRRLLNPDEPVPLLPLNDPSEREQLIRAALTAWGGSAIDEAQISRGVDAARALGTEGNPLNLMMAAAFATSESHQNGTTMNREDIAQYFAVREKNRISEIAVAGNVTESFLLHMAAYSTLSHGLNEAEAARAVREEARARGIGASVDQQQVLDVLKSALPGETRTSVGPVLPDLIGEAFLLSVWGDE